MITEKEQRAIGFRVIQRVSYRKRLFRSPVKIFTGYDIFKWTGEAWVAIPVIEV